MTQNQHDESPLLAAMRQQIAATPMPVGGRRLLPQILIAVRGRPRMLAGASAGLAAAAAAVALAFVGATSPPAFAVTTNPGGTVTITLNQLTAVSGLNAKLAAMGVNVRAAPVVSGCNAPVQLVGSDAPPATLQARPLVGFDTQGDAPATAGALASVTVTTDIPAGQTLVLAASRSGLDVVGQTVQGPSPSCVAPAAG